VAINSTDEERQKQADKDLATKLRLEQPFERQLNQLFDNIAYDLGLQYAATGTPVSISEYEEELAAVIFGSNLRTSNAFSGQVIETSVADKTNEVAIAVLAIAAAKGLSMDEHVLNMRVFAREHTRNVLRNNSKEAASEIVNTLQKDADTAVAKAKVEEDLTRAGVGAKASQDFKERSLSRASTIATTETQRAAEGTKEIERGIFVRENSGMAAALAGVPAVKVSKYWMTRGDSKVRPAHIAADSQESEDGFFSVGGELLRFPGDPDGSSWNVINCRCSAVVEVS